MGWSFSGWYGRWMQRWAHVGPGRCANCRALIGRAQAVDGRFCSESCARDAWEMANS